jgi:uncharacterized membrane protein YgcG
MTDGIAAEPQPEDPRVVFISAASGLASDWRWVEGTAHLYDVVHWHDDVEGVTVAQARGLVQALLAAQKPLVITVPPDVLDTALPAFGDEGRVDAFAVLVPAAAAVVARDGGSAEAVWRAWGRTCLVVPDGEEEQVSVNLYRAVIAQEPFAIDGLHGLDGSRGSDGFNGSDGSDGSDDFTGSDGSDGQGGLSLSSPAGRQA